jgi:hypothetical protein
MAKKQISYESEHTRFMREWLQQHPEQQEVQKTGRALWWDKPQTPQALRKFMEAYQRRRTPPQ